MKNLFKFAFVAFALTAFTACGDQGAATEVEGVETTEEATDATLEEATPADADMDATMPADTTVMDSTTVIQ